MKTKKFNEKRNICGELIEKYREDAGMTKTDLSKKLELYGVYLHRNEIYRIENGFSLLKDFELAAIAEVLEIDLNSIKNLIK